MVSNGEWVDIELPVIKILDTEGSITTRWRAVQEAPFLSFNGQFSHLHLSQLSQWISGNHEDSEPSGDAGTAAGITFDLPLLSSPMNCGRCRPGPEHPTAIMGPLSGEQYYPEWSCPRWLVKKSPLFC